MKKLLIPLLLLSACSRQEDETKAPPTGNAAAVAPAAQPAAPAAPPRLGSLIGLYEGGGSGPKHQMCVVEGKGGETRFGLVVWGGNMHSCSGAGSVSRDGSALRLVMAGDSACTIEAAISGQTVKLPDQLPQGCAYYCGARAKISGAELTRSGTTETDAMKAKDLVGDPLCATEGR